MARATFIAKASASNFVSDFVPEFVPELGVSVVALLMKATVTIHSVFVTAKLAGFALNRREDVLHCDKASCFCHNRGAPLWVWALDDFSLVPFVGSNGLSLGRLLG
ncbi:hypothetical protein [Bradyrhizobium sp. WSM3983]|uniref:hypothetical protein n=1 Tax=Bradyrhizobium sp. WSM3983 TaxID=1038867 RepID=UPI0018DBD849|nr:hypothetical protein [Bradyrhizobium sp. WSM3983]